MVSSFDSQVLERVAEQAPGVAVGLITIDPADAAVAETLGFDALHLFSLLVNDESAVADVHDRGLSLAVWTENDPFRIELLAELGVEKIITDDPDVATEVIDNLPQPSDGGCTAGGTSPPTASLALLVLLLWRRP